MPALKNRRRVVTYRNVSTGRRVRHLILPGRLVRSLCGQVYAPPPDALLRPHGADHSCRTCVSYSRKPACRVCWLPVEVRTDGTACSHRSGAPTQCRGTGLRVHRRPPVPQAR